MDLKKKLGRIGIALGIVAAGVGAFTAYQLCWLTSAERDAAHAALAAVDGLQTYNALSDDQFDAKAQQAEETVETAREAALTVRDQKVAFALRRYLGSIEVEQGVIRMQKQAQRDEADSAEGYVLVDSSVHAGRTAATRSLRLSLHEALD
jgi:hypothetical protein